MILDLRPLFCSEKNKLELDCSIDLSQMNFLGTKPLSSPVSVKTVVSTLSGSVQLDAKVKFVYASFCDRCADAISQEYNLDFSHVLVNEINNPENDDYILLEDMKLDLDELIISDIVLNLPTKVLCKHDCKGICQRCGKNLNYQTCTCDKNDIDPRLEALKKLL